MSNVALRTPADGIRGQGLPSIRETVENKTEEETKRLKPTDKPTNDLT